MSGWEGRRERRDPAQGELLPLEEDIPRLREAGVLVLHLAAALCDRDTAAIQRLLDEPGAHRLPRDVREEALAFLTLPATSMRAPVQTLIYSERLMALLNDAMHARGWRRAG